MLVGWVGIACHVTLSHTPENRSFESLALGVRLRAVSDAFCAVASRSTKVTLSSLRKVPRSRRRCCQRLGRSIRRWHGNGDLAGDHRDGRHKARAAKDQPAYGRSPAEGESSATSLITAPPSATRIGRLRSEGLSGRPSLESVFSAISASRTAAKSTKTSALETLDLRREGLLQRPLRMPGCWHRWNVAAPQGDLRALS